MSKALSRSEQMARIGGRNTSPEKRLRSLLWRSGLRYRLHARTPGGRPDIVFPGRKVAVFVDGCFWHGCPDHYVRPRSRAAFWSKKLSDNVARDRRQTLQLEGDGWTVIRIWEHEVHEDPLRLAETIGIVVTGKGPGPEDQWRVVRVDALDSNGDLEERHMEMLRIPERSCAVRQKRHTRKWKRGASG